MTNFTQSNFKKMGLYAFALLCSMGMSTLLQAQSDYTMTVNAPAGLAGTYDAVLATFGPDIPPCEFSGELVAITDGTGGTLACDTIVNDLTGKIAVIDRGVCNFSIKVFEAQEKGAIGVIVVTNSDAAIFAMGAGTNSELITIPSWMITLADGTAIKPEIMNGVTVTFNQDPASYLPGETVLWGDQAGEGDFNGGLNDWVANTITCAGTPSDVDVFTWSADGFADGSCASGTIFSPTRCNGAITVESDFIDNNGTGCGGAAVGSGDCPAPQIAELTSPMITLDGSSTADLVVRFHQHLREFSTNYFLAWTTDGGTVWDTTQFNQDVELDDADFSAVNDIARVTMEGTAGATSLQFKFIVNADYYYWIIDDVQVVETAANNLQVDAFYAVPPNAATPLAFVEPFGFLADISNQGTATQTNTNLNVTILNTNGDVVFTADRPYGSVIADTTIENLPFDDTFTPTAAGQYFGRYSITADSSDSDITNNIQDFTFLVTDNIFSKDLAGPTNATRPADAEWEGTNEAHSWAWGTCYYVPTAQGYFATDVSFGFQIADAGAVGKDLVIFLYKWVDTNDDDQADPDEREFVGFANYTITGNEAFRNLITLPITTLEGTPIQLEDDTYYLAMVEYTTNDQNNIFISFSDAIDYAAMNLASDSLGMSRYAGMLGINDDLAVEPYSSLGFGFDFVPTVRLTVSSVDPTSAKDLQVLQSKFEITPNPVSDVLNLQLNLDQAASNATVRMFDVSGKMLQQWNYDNVQKERFEYNVNQLNSGTYFLQVITAEGSGTQKFVVK